jgi:hypothetical protein
MNIFYLSKNPIEAAEWMVDRHVVKMILESAQLLSTAHRILDGEEIPLEVRIEKEDGTIKTRKKKWWMLHDARESVLYSATHINHPSAIWARSSIENYNWLVDHFFALMQEYTYRYDKEHKCYGELSYMLASPPKNMTEFDMTPMLCAMAEEYIISDDPVSNYRNYYKNGKQHLFSWKRREPPEWILNQQ